MSEKNKPASKTAPKAAAKAQAAGKNNSSVFIALLVLSLVLLTVLGISISEKAKQIKALEQQIADLQQEIAELNEKGGQDANAVSGDMPGTYACISIKDYGDITFRLDAENAPISVANFKELAQSGFYNGLTFHRIIEGFMMQGGDPNGNGSGGSDKNIKGEFSANGVNNTLSHKRGVVSMARAQSYDSASSQFFICHQDSTFLDGQYAAFGVVTEGMEVVDAICSSAAPTDSNGSIAKEQQPVISSITIFEK